MDDPPPRVEVTAINDYNVALALQVWLTDEIRHMGKRYELWEKVFNEQTVEGVDMPFEILRLTTVDVFLSGKRK